MPASSHPTEQQKPPPSRLQAFFYSKQRLVDANRQRLPNHRLHAKPKQVPRRSGQFYGKRRNGGTRRNLQRLVDLAMNILFIKTWCFEA